MRNNFLSTKKLWKPKRWWYKTSYYRMSRNYQTEIQRHEGAGLFRKKKSIEKKCLYRHDKNYSYFWASNIPAVALLVDYINMIKVSKNVSLWKIRWAATVVFTKNRQFLSVLLLFLNGAEFWKVEWISDKKWYVMRNYIPINFLWTSRTVVFRGQIKKNPDNLPLRFFESLIIFLEPTIKLVTGLFVLQK